MNSLWNDHEAAEYTGDLAQRVYTSRLLGRDKSLVLHGGGNTSLKLRQPDFFGVEEDVLYVKGSGWDLERIEAAGFSPVRLSHLLKLAQLDAMTDAQMVDQLRIGLTNPSAPMPSVEAILHAIIPFKYVDHTHADAFIAVCNTPSGEGCVREIYGDDVLVVPYVMPGFRLARLCAQTYVQHITGRTLGMALTNHGLVTWGETARESYERHIELVSRAERYLQQRNAWQIAWPPVKRSAQRKAITLAQLRADISEVAGAPMIVKTLDDDKHLAFAQRDDILTISQQGPATPDHVIGTKRVPMLGRDVEAYAADYERYFARLADAPSQSYELTMLDPAPRVVIDPELGVCAVGRSATDAHIVADIYEHTMEIILRATALKRWQALSERDLFEVGYWDLEQAKLKRQPQPGKLAGRIALVTGAASGIGKACVESLRARGAAVIALDVNKAMPTVFSRSDVLGIQCDITDEAQVTAAIEGGVKAFGGLDMLVLNAGIFPPSQRVEDIMLKDWRTTMEVNLDANMSLLSLCHPLLKLAPSGGSVVVVGSKNVPAPGPGAAAYSASKAALTQLARVTALEWGADGIRLNVVHPNAVFDTSIWSDNILKARAQHYGMTVEQYKTNNVLGVAITSHDVAELVAEMCGPLFAKTTGAQVPIDGGNDRVI